MPKYPDNYIRCKYCEWKTLRFRGKKTGFATLRMHVFDEHPEGKDALLQLDEEYNKSEIPATIPKLTGRVI